MSSYLLRLLLASSLAASPALVFGQNRALPRARVPIELQQTANRAGIIFSGRVTSIVPTRAASPDRAATVTITFQVEDAVRGVKAGQIYSFREWAGLWSAGPRYRVGQRLLLFLYAPSRLGLTSPVGGRSGMLSVDLQGRVLLPSQPGDPGIARSAKTAAAPLRVKDIALSLRRMRED
jgi:hypothetical protein